MAIIKCKMCGGEVNLSPDKTFGTCEYCGSTMTFPKVDDDQRAAAFNRGNHFRRAGEFDKALSVYERLVEQDDADAEAHWCCALCRFGIEYVEDPATREWLPTCHRASFDSFLEDVDYLAALEHSDGVTRQLYEKDAAKIVQVQRGILATSQNEKPFDVFLCYKETDEQGRRTVDSTLAQDIYYQLTEQGMRVFFARITLEDKAGAEYEPYIFAALNSAKVMVAIGTKPEHFNAVWVKNEWSRYLSMMKKDRHKLLIPCYRGMDPYDLPDELAVLQSYDMARIGFIQDLIRGVRKVVDAEKKPEPRAAAPRSEAGGQAALVRRGYMTLEDGDWAKSDELFENALNLEPENAEAQVGKWLTSVRQKTLAGGLRAKREQDFSNIKAERLTAFALDRQHVDAAAARHAVPGYLKEDEIRAFYQFDPQYPSKLPALRAAQTAAQNWLKNERYLSRARKFAGKDYQKELDDAFGDFLKGYDEAVARAEAEDKAVEEKLRKDYAAHLAQADGRAQEAQREAEARRERDYQAACKKLDAAKTLSQFKDAKNAFSKIAAYKDSNDKMRRCDEEIEHIQAEEAAAAAARKKARKKKRNIFLISAAVVALVVIVFFVITQVILPAGDYSKAEALLQAGDYDGAIAAFTELGDYKDAADRVLEARYRKAELILQNGDYDGAIAAFTELGDYKDAADRVLEARYRKAELILQNGDYDGAIAAFTELGDYKDAADRALEVKNRVLEATYAKGEALLQSNDFDGAIAVFSELGDYKDAADRVLEARYSKAELILRNGDYDGAIAAFTELGDYKDAADRVLEVQYTKAEAFLQAGDTQQAAVAFGKAIGYRDARERSFALWDGVAVRDTVAAGDDHTVGLKADGTVVAVGYNNNYGQCDVDGWTDIVAIAAGGCSGGYHTVGLKADGTVVAVGWNGVGQCNVGDWTDIVAIAAGGWNTVGLKADGTVVAVGDNGNGQCFVGDWTDIVAIAAGYWHTVGLKADGTVVAVGSNGGGQCEVGDWTDIVAIAAESDYTVGLKADGTVVAVGDNGNGQCEVGDWTDTVAIAAGLFHTVGLKADGTVVAVGDNGDGQCEVGGWTGIVAIAAGSDYTVGLKVDGTVVAVGWTGGGAYNVQDWRNIKLPDRAQ